MGIEGLKIGDVLYGNEWDVMGERIEVKGYR
jgi:hypothetical protein